jgi:integrase
MEMTQKASEFDSMPVVPQPVLEGPLAPLLESQAMAEGAYSANTLRAQKVDGAIFQAFCESREKMGRETSARQDQAHPLNWNDIKEFIESAGEGLRADRERALLCVTYETLTRRSELVALKIRDIDFHPDGAGLAPIRRGKMDA